MKKGIKRKITAVKTSSNGQFYASFSVTFNWKLLDLRSIDWDSFSPPGSDQVEFPQTEVPNDHYLALSALIDCCFRLN